MRGFLVSVCHAVLIRDVSLLVFMSLDAGTGLHICVCLGLAVPVGLPQFLGSVCVLSHSTLALFFCGWKQTIHFPAREQ